MWNPHTRFTTSEYAQHVMLAAKLSCVGPWRPTVNSLPVTPSWWRDREVWMFWEPGIGEKAALTVRDAIAKRAEEAGLRPFDFRLFGRSHHIERYGPSLMGGVIDEERFFGICLEEEERSVREHATVLITRKAFVGDNDAWGAASWRHGAMVFALHGRRQENDSYLRSVALHEANHLFGMFCHCDSYQNVEGHSYNPRCNMHYSCPSDMLCPKCEEFIRHWWVQVEHETEGRA